MVQKRGQIYIIVLLKNNKKLKKLEKNPPKLLIFALFSYIIKSSWSKITL